MVRKGKSLGGFTIVELVVTVAIMVTLMSLSLVAFSATRKSARDSKRKSDLEQIRSALEMYRSDIKDYPATGTVSCGASIAGGGTTYMSSVPCDPNNPTYQYAYTRLNANQYCLCTYLEKPVTSPSSCTCSDICGSTACNYKVSNP